MKKKIILIVGILILATSVFSQSNVNINYTKPFFQGNVRVMDTLGVDTLYSSNGKMVIVDSIGNGGSAPELDPVFTGHPASGVVNTGLGDLFLSNDGSYLPISIIDYSPRIVADSLNLYNFINKYVVDSTAFEDSILLNSAHRYVTTGNPHQLDIIDIPNLSDSLSNAYDGDGIYSGSGSVPSNTNAALTDQLVFGSNLIFLDGVNDHVGIGKSSPDFRLDVSHQGGPFVGAKFSASATDGVYIGEGGTTRSYLGFNSYYRNSGQYRTEATEGALFEYFPSATPYIRWALDNGLTSGVDYIPTERMRLTNDGNLGIGENPTARLHVKGSGVGSGQSFLIENAVGEDNFTVLDNGNTSIRGELTIENSTNGIETLTLGGASATRAGIIFRSGIADPSQIYDRIDGTFSGGLIFESRTNDFIFADKSGDIAGSTIFTGALSQVRIIESATVTPLIIRGGTSPNDLNDGVFIQTADDLNVMRNRFYVTADAANVNAHFTDVTGVSFGSPLPATSMVTVSGDVETKGVNDGYIVNDRLDGNRYRIYTENGILFTELVP